MRKFLMAVAMVGLAIVVATPAMALDFKFGAEYRVRFFDYMNTGFDSSNTLATQGGSNNPGSNQSRGNPRGVQLRVRPRFDVTDDNGNIAATLRLETGDTTWGAGGGAGADSWGTNNSNTVPAGSTNRTGNGAGGAIGADGVSLEVKWAFMDFAIPNIPLRVRAGIQPWYLPKGLVVDDDAAGVRAYGNYGDLNYEAWWYRIATTPASNSAAAGLIGQPRFDSTKNDAFDLYGAKLGYNFAEWLNASMWYMYGANYANCTNPNNVGVNVTGTGYISGPCNQNVLRQQNWFGVDLVGKVKSIEYDIDFVYGMAKGGNLGSFVYGSVNQSTGATSIAGGTANNSAPVDVKGYAVDGGVHIPIGPVKLNLLGSYASGDAGKNNSNSSGAYPYGVSPSWSGAGGQYELIGEGGAFDVVSMTQHSPSGLWMLGFTVEYVPVKALWLKLAYGYAGFTGKWANCAWAFTPNAAGVLVQNPNTTCYGPVYYGKPSDNMVGSSSLGQEVHLRADYTMWTGFKVQAMAGWLFPSSGDVAGKYILQLLYNF
jgi:hypothetical protein